MSIHIVRRADGEPTKRESMLGRVQFSYNSDGHFVIRVLHDTKSDTLIVLDDFSSAECIKFIKMCVRYPANWVTDDNGNSYYPDGKRYDDELPF